MFKKKPKRKSKTAKLTLTLEKLEELKATLKKQINEFANHSDHDSVDHDTCTLEIFLELEDRDMDNEFDFDIIDITPVAYSIDYHGSYWDRI